MLTMKPFLSSLAALLLCLAAPLSASAPQKEKFNQGPWENEIGYAQAVRVGNLLYISGSTGSGPMPQALAQAMDGIQRSLAHYKLGFAHVVKENIYTTDIEALKAHKEVRKAYYKGDFPAATWVQVVRLFSPEQVIEIEVVAVISDKAAQ
jgi:enamine deaminase RidA (YjgF/YER057c/UK114 family)